jgi:Response regulator containing CheY-like receiver domain and AraC-type DNA-binding domain
MARKLLIVEDEKADREGLESFVDWSSFGLELLPSAADGAEGLDRITSYNPAIVITDLRMPAMGGLEMIERAREAVSDREAQSEFVIASGYDEFDYARRALRLGVAEYLLKPIEREPLEKCLRSCVERLDARDRRRLSWAELAPGESSGYKEADAALAELEAGLRGLAPKRIEAAIGRVRGALRESAVRRDAVLDSIVDRWLSNCLELRARENSALGETMLGRIRAATSLEALGDAIAGIAADLAAGIEADAGAKRSDLVRLAVEIIHRDYSRSLSLKSIADEIGVSPNYLGRLFAEVEGIGFSDYLTKIRMAEAQRLLAEGRLKVKAVAEAVGCPNVPYFCTLFKSVYGVSPSKYAD